MSLSSPHKGDSNTKGFQVQHALPKYRRIGLECVETRDMCPMIRVKHQSALLRLSDKVLRNALDPWDQQWFRHGHGLVNYLTETLVHSKRTAFIDHTDLYVYDREFTTHTRCSFPSESTILSVLELEDRRLVVSRTANEDSDDGCIDVFSADLTTVLHRRTLDCSYRLCLPYRAGVLALNCTLSTLEYLDFVDSSKDEVLGGDLEDISCSLWAEEETIWLCSGFFSGAPTLQRFTRASGLWTRRLFEMHIGESIQRLLANEDEQAILLIRLRSGVFVCSRLHQRNSPRTELIVWETSDRVVDDKLVTRCWTRGILEGFSAIVEDDEDPRCFFLVGQKNYLRIRVRTPSDSLVDRCAFGIACVVSPPLLKDILPAELVTRCMVYVSPPLWG